MIIQKTILTSLFIGISFLLSGCSIVTNALGAQGPKFNEFKQAKKEHGMLYIYRPSAVYGSPLTWDIHIEDSKSSEFIAGTLLNGGYISIELPVGETQVWSKIDGVSIVGIDIQEGKVSCVKSGMISAEATTRVPELETVNITQCKSEIIKTNLVQ